MSAPTPAPPAPTAAQLLADPIVLAAMEQAWQDSLPNDPGRRHEEGGWIYADMATGVLTTRRAPAGARARLPLDNPPVVARAVVVGTFHTHPNPSADGWDPTPSPTDQASAIASGVPWLIRSDSGNFQTGPTSRVGGLRGSPGFPP